MQMQSKMLDKHEDSIRGISGVAARFCGDLTETQVVGAVGK